MFKDLHLALGDGNRNDVDRFQLHKEILFNSTTRQSDQLLEIEQGCCKISKSFSDFEYFSHFRCNCFSELKLIKTYLQSTVSQERLVGLATMTTERDLLKNIEIEKKFFG
ncbi:hypothetical protein AVEN_239034-1 [Araneus ventricosus]|uniref:Uncharacterized protein n=1 Tax=Araneus ventricosus TaxID=182803 RepID=A0A4Y2PEW9_ARAVE|nr:hypothetical protein AVEN_239034-1 [Araneus ventricosus]